MAIARPVRALALAGLFILIFCFYNIFQPGSGAHDLASLKTSADFHGTIERDPNLDRERSHPILALRLRPHSD
jgi:mannosyltransferase